MRPQALLNQGTIFVVTLFNHCHPYTQAHWKECFNTLKHFETWRHSLIYSISFLTFQNACLTHMQNRSISAPKPQRPQLAPVSTLKSNAYKSDIVRLEIPFIWKQHSSLVVSPQNPKGIIFSEALTFWMGEVIQKKRIPDSKCISYFSYHCDKRQKQFKGEVCLGSWFSKVYHGREGKAVKRQQL